MSKPVPASDWSYMPIGQVLTELDRSQRMVGVLQARLALAVIDAADELPSWSVNLTAQETALVAILGEVWPKGLSKLAIEDNLPWQDHVEERSPEAVRHVVWRVRCKLGVGAIETIHGRGFRCGEALAARVKAEARPREPGSVST